jgi:hypothetical protein
VPRSAYRVRIALLTAALLTSSTSVARADRVDDLCRVLVGDPSWRVRVQAAAVLRRMHEPRAMPSLLRALDDPSESVRGVAAEVLGELDDARAVDALERVRRDRSAFVRQKAADALARLQRPPSTAPSRGGPVKVFVGGVGSKARHLPASLTIRLRELVTRELERTPGLTLEGQPLSGFLIDSAITEMSQRTTDDWVEISCEVSLIVGRLPSKAMVMMTSGGATVQAPKLGFRPERALELQTDALEGAVHGAHENLLAFLKTQH